MQLKTPSYLFILMMSGAAAAESSWENEAELGLLMKSGNTDERKFNGRLSTLQDSEWWRNRAEARSLFSKSAGITSTEKYLANFESDYKFAPHQFVFLKGKYEDDRFSGFDFESSLVAGYGNRVWEEAEAFLELRLGAGYRYNKLKVPNDQGAKEEEGGVLNAGGRFEYPLSESASFLQVLNVEYGVDDYNTITDSETAVQARLKGSLSLKAAYRVKNQSRPPQGDEKTDTETTLSLLYGF